MQTPAVAYAASVSAASTPMDCSADSSSLATVAAVAAVAAVASVAAPVTAVQSTPFPRVSASFAAGHAARQQRVRILCQLLSDDSPPSSDFARQLYRFYRAEWIRSGQAARDQAAREQADRVLAATNSPLLYAAPKVERSHQLPIIESLHSGFLTAAVSFGFFSDASSGSSSSVAANDRLDSLASLLYAAIVSTKEWSIENPCARVAGVAEVSWSGVKDRSLPTLLNSVGPLDPELADSPAYGSHFGKLFRFLKRVYVDLCTPVLTDLQIYGDELKHTSQMVHSDVRSTARLRGSNEGREIRLDTLIIQFLNQLLHLVVILFEERNMQPVVINEHLIHILAIGQQEVKGVADQDLNQLTRRCSLNALLFLVSRQAFPPLVPIDLSSIIAKHGPWQWNASMPPLLSWTDVMANLRGPLYGATQFGTMQSAQISFADAPAPIDPLCTQLASLLIKSWNFFMTKAE